MQMQMKRKLAMVGLGLGAMVMLPYAVSRLRAGTEAAGKDGKSRAQDAGRTVKEKTCGHEAAASTRTDRNGKSSEDHERQGLLRRAIVEGEHEIDAGWLAVKRSGNQEVVEFGRKMANLHDAANKKLINIAGKLGLTLPERTEEEVTEELQALKEAGEGGFDRRYLKGQLATHKTLVEVFSGLARDTLYPELASFARESLDMIRGHIKEAESLQEKLA